MNTNKLNKTELENWKKYIAPGQTELYRVKINVVHINTANSLAHELKKCELAYQFMKEGNKIITEAVDLKTNLRRDLVNLSTDEIYEIENSKMERSRRHPTNINVVYYNK